MPDWKRIAAGWNLDLPEEDLDRIVPVLDALVERLRALLPMIPLLIEPALTFRCRPEEEP